MYKSINNNSTLFSSKFTLACSIILQNELQGRKVKIWHSEKELGSFKNAKTECWPKSDIRASKNCPKSSLVVQVAQTDRIFARISTTKRLPPRRLSNDRNCEELNHPQTGRREHTQTELLGGHGVNNNERHGAARTPPRASFRKRAVKVLS